jgi:DNA-binding IclR family transcriptional regulator
MAGTAISRGNIRSIERALKILELVQGADELGITEIATRLSLPKGTTHGVVKTLEKHGYLEQNLQTRKYRCGPTLIQMGLAVVSRLDLRRLSQQKAQRLSEKFNQVAYVTILVRDMCMVVAYHAPNRFFVLLPQTGSSFPAYSTAMGKVLLAALPPAQFDEIFQNMELQRFTAYTITDKEALKERLREVSKRGYDVTHQESVIGLSCVAAPIRNHTGKVVASISIAAPTTYLGNDKRLASVVKEVVKAGEEISIALGYSTSVAISSNPFLEIGK